jgi:Tol biopolymer transport system component
MALWVVDVGSGREKQISEEPVLLVQPCWSPDGGWLAYIAPGSSETMQRLMICSLDGAVIRQLAEAPAIRGTSWRPKTGDGAEE